MLFIKSVFTCFTIWVLTALVNALLAGTCLFLFSDEFKFSPGAFVTAFIFTLVFSIPGVIIFWIVLLINRGEAMLFRILLKTSLVVSAVSSLILFVPVFYKPDQPVVLLFCCVIAAITSVMVHHARIVSVFSHQINNDHV